MPHCRGFRAHMHCCRILDVDAYALLRHAAGDNPLRSPGSDQAGGGEGTRHTDRIVAKHYSLFFLK